MKEIRVTNGNGKSERRVLFGGAHSLHLRTPPAASCYFQPHSRPTQFFCPTNRTGGCFYKKKKFDWNLHKFDLWPLAAMKAFLFFGVVYREMIDSCEMVAHLIECSCFIYEKLSDDIRWTAWHSRWLHKESTNFGYKNPKGEEWKTPLPPFWNALKHIDTQETLEWHIAENQWWLVCVSLLSDYFSSLISLYNKYLGIYRHFLIFFLSFVSLWMDSLDLRVNRVAGNSRLVATRGGVDFSSSTPFAVLHVAIQMSVEIVEVCVQLRQGRPVIGAHGPAVGHDGESVGTRNFIRTRSSCCVNRSTYNSSGQLSGWANRYPSRR